jgi:Flp pilus assembly protein TadD
MLSQRNALGHTLGRQDKLEEDVKYLNEALRIKPDFASAHANLGYVLATEGKFYEAVAHFNQALRIEPNYTAVRNALEAATEKQKLKNTNK